MAFPISGVPAFVPLAHSADLASIYAVARQESEFLWQASSGAGAKGLMQLLPSTAASTARRAGVAFDYARLLVDPAFNTQLGAAFLGQVREDEGGSDALAFAAYNAGGGRVAQWIAAHGDPRKTGGADLVDWIERIPFDETRDYVERVSENLGVYRQRLADEPPAPAPMSPILARESNSATLRYFMSPPTSGWPRSEDGRACVDYVPADHLAQFVVALARERPQPFDIVCVMRERTPMTRAIIERLPKLRLIASTATRNASIDLKAAEERGVQVVHTGYTPAPTIELTWALILGSARDLVAENAALRGCGLAGAHDDGTPRGRRGKVRRNSFVRGRRGYRGVEHVPQQLPLSHGRRLPASCPPDVSGRRLFLADFVASETFEHASHAGMVPPSTPCRHRRVEEFLARGRIRQADAERARTLQREVQILLMEGDPEAGLEIALDHAFAVDLENARCGESAHQSLAHAGRISASLGGEEQRLADRLDRQRDDDLIGDLGRLSVAVTADERDVLAHERKDRLDLLESGLRAANHDGETRRFRAHFAPRNRRVEIFAAERVDLLGELLGGDWRDRAHVDDDLAGRKSLRDAFGAEEHRLDVGRIGDHGDDHLGVAPDLLPIGAGDGALIGQFFRRRAARVNEELVAAVKEVPGHRASHDAETDETDLCHLISPASVKSRVQAALLAR